MQGCIKLIKSTVEYYKLFPFQINAVVFNYVFVKESFKKLFPEQQISILE